MKSSAKPTVNTEVNTDEFGKAIARGIAEQNAQKERNMQKAIKRKETMLKNAAESMFNQNFSV